MSPISHPQADVYLLGFISACSLVAGLFFFRYWRATRDFLFLAFAMFFIIQSGTQATVVTLAHPNEGSVWLFLLRLLSVVLVLGAILWKNSRR